MPLDHFLWQACQLARSGGKLAIPPCQSEHTSGKVANCRGLLANWQYLHASQSMPVARCKWKNDAPCNYASRPLAASNRGNLSLSVGTLARSNSGKNLYFYSFLNSIFFQFLYIFYILESMTTTKWMRKDKDF